MECTISKEALLQPLQLVTGVVERRQTLPILSNALLVVTEDKLSITGTDLEVELVAWGTPQAVATTGSVTTPARKLMDICRSLPDEAIITLKLEENRLLVKSGRSRYRLSLLPVDDFPKTEQKGSDIEFPLEQSVLKNLIDSISFAMAQQDVRFYLNGLLMEVGEGRIRTVATDGHRLALCNAEVGAEQTSGPITQIIIPRKGAVELSRLLSDSQGVATVTLGSGFVRVGTDDFLFSSKLVDGKFPDYQNVIPSGGDKELIADRQLLRDSFVRASILSSDKFHGVRLFLSEELLKLKANNPEQEEAEEDIEVDYNGGSVEIGFNVTYMIDVMNTLSSEKVRITLSGPDNGVIIERLDNPDALYVVMPMKI
ncbi:MAG: DNA polymerase III subunit beta [Pseudomonadales bacterium]|nr:DNA polymerase III subunit beta [Pseudomonadales bacterium]